MQGSPDWLGDDNSPLEGFPWRGGADRDTTGILMWSRPFVITLLSGEQVNFSSVVTTFPPSGTGSNFQKINFFKLIIFSSYYLFLSVEF